MYVTLLDSESLKVITIDSYNYVGQIDLLNNVSPGKFCSLDTDSQICLASHPVKDCKYIKTHPILN